MGLRHAGGSQGAPFFVDRVELASLKHANFRNY